MRNLGVVFAPCTWGLLWFVGASLCGVGLLFQ